MKIFYLFIVLLSGCTTYQSNQINDIQLQSIKDRLEWQYRHEGSIRALGLGY